MKHSSCKAQGCARPDGRNHVPQLADGVVGQKSLGVVLEQGLQDAEKGHEAPHGEIECPRFRGGKPGQAEDAQLDGETRQESACRGGALL